MSDSDSDICDLFSDFSKKIEKSEDKFWNKFTSRNKKESVRVEEVPLKNSGDGNAEKTEPAGMESVPSKEVSIQQGEESEDVAVLSDQSGSSDVELLAETKENSDFVLTTINNRIENVSEKLKEILDGPSTGKGARRKGRGKRTQQPTRKSKRTKPRKPQNISQPVILSDEDDEKVMLVPLELNPTVTVNVLWKSVETHKFKLKKFDRLTSIKDYYVKNKQVDPKLLFFTLHNKEFQLEDNSYVSLKLTDNEIIEGSVLPEAYLNNKTGPSYYNDQYDYIFKVQISSYRSKPFPVKCKSSDKMDVIFWQVMLETGKNFADVKLYFDGQLLRPDEKIATLDLENGDCFDLILET